MKKQIDRAFGKDVYLLGTFTDGSKFWLEAASFDCEWYWKFGYIETYTGKSPSRSTDINNHQHYNSICFKEINNEYIYKLSDNPEVAECVLTENEQWELSDLMKSFYTLSSAAGFFHRGGSYLFSINIQDNLKDAKLNKHINEFVLPKIFKRVYELLTPKEGK